ncbi:uncharacterized protein BKCO1_30000104 [Diplodia corticola]|uniref:Rhodopsin domain-containing protein n=1 Tax=Diplodia corticola TaxID=236234 RepID=A0A1J9RYT4_9PEZI|nr:uncharacterized protein BKCO1_30000104 [Diplodia corticola]OJD33511.1 hypothetical protein BKCO1_30000104 [Diplodia corticola]
MSMSVRSLLVETWIEYGFSTIMIAMRLFTRFKMVGGRLQKDDYLMILAWAFFTTMSVCAHIVSLNGDNRAMTNEQRLQLPAAERDAKILGSKFFLTGHLTYVSTIWTLKLCMLLFFARLTRGLSAEKFVKPAIGVVGVTWLAEFLTVLLTCRPVQRNWQIYPDPGKLCTHESAVWYIVQVIFNVLTDAVIVPIPMPLVIKAKVSTAKKLGLVVLLGAGIFVMVAATLRVVFVLTNAAPSEPAIWAMRECFVATFVGNAPMIRPMFTRKFYQGGYDDNDMSHGYTNGSVPLDAYGTSGSKNATSRMFGSKAGTNIDVESDSTENIIESTSGNKFDHTPNFGIRVQHSVAVSSHSNVPSTFGDEDRKHWSPT